LVRFQVPKVAEVKAYLVELPDGRLVVRTEEELREIPKKEESSERK
jgi:hypothetical protein